jgi:protein-S-isoprenylcysteine O-methyltransferase Ste14
MRPISQIGPPRASAVARVLARRYDSSTPSADVAIDALLAAAWCALVLDGVWQTSREHHGRAALGPVVVQAWPPSVAAGLAVLATTLAAAVALERMTGRFPFRVAPASVGVALAVMGVLLHGWARRTLGPMWSGVVQVRAQHVVIDRGPYRLVRHPIYVAGLLMAMGTFLAHPSAATACLAIGLTAGMLLKAWLEERALRTALGDAYSAYAARVPAFLPRVRRS